MHPATRITGTTRLYGLVGDPLTTAKSPELLNRLFVEQHADAVCVPFHVKADGLSAFVTGARAIGNLSGVLVTMPHKQRMMAFVDELDPTARQVGALNVIRCDNDGRWVGAMFDGLGCVLGMQWEDCGPFRTDHWQYVFGNERPKPNLNKGAGLDVSPAVRDFLGMNSSDVTDWKFVDFDEVPTGPWATHGNNNTFVINKRAEEDRLAFARAQRLKVQ